MRKKIRSIFLGLTLGIMSTIFSQSIAFGEELLIGGIVPLSGPAASWGIGMLRGLEMATDEVNAKGGLKINGKTYTLKLAFYDHKCQANEALTITNKLVFSDKVKFILAGSVGATCRAVQTVTAPNWVMFAMGCWGKMLLGPKVPLNYRFGFSPYEMSDPYLAAIKKLYPQAKTIATISPNDTSGWDGAKGDIRAAKKVGIECVAEEYYERGQTDFHATLTRILAKKPDILDLATTPMSTGGIILKQAYELGYRGPKAWTACSVAAIAIKIAGKEAAEDLYLSVNFDYFSPKYTLPALREIAKRNMERYGEPMDYYGFAAYAHGKIVFQNMEKTQSIDPAKIAEAIVVNQPYDTIYGPVVYGNEAVYGLPRAMLHPMVLSRVHNGKLENISYALHPDLSKVVGDWKFPE